MGASGFQPVQQRPFQSLKEFGLHGNQDYQKTSRLFECISVKRKKGSPKGYYAETGEEAPAQKPQTGEPNERYSLYRIRRTQETHQLLQQGRQWRSSPGREADSATFGVARMGEPTTGALARSHGSDPVQRVDLRHAETLRCTFGDSTSGDAEGNQRRKEEERPNRRTHHCRHGALQPAANLLCSHTRDSRASSPAALSQSCGTPVRAHAEQDGRPLDGVGHSFHQRKATW